MGNPQFYVSGKRPISLAEPARRAWFIYLLHLRVPASCYMCCMNAYSWKGTYCFVKKFPDKKVWLLFEIISHDYPWLHPTSRNSMPCNETRVLSQKDRCRVTSPIFSFSQNYHGSLYQSNITSVYGRYNFGLVTPLNKSMTKMIHWLIFQNTQIKKFECTSELFPSATVTPGLFTIATNENYMVSVTWWRHQMKTFSA